MELFERIQTLCQTFGPSGDEGEIREVIRRMAEPLADEVTEDVLGSLTVHRKGEGPRLLLSAHMDTVGFVVTHIDRQGFLYCGALGGISAREAVYSPVRFRNGTAGVLVPEEKAEFGKLKLDQCCIDIGAKDRKEASMLVKPGDTAVFAGETRRNGRSVISPCLDNRVSCAVLLTLLEDLPPSGFDLWLVFSSQEEVGTRGIRTAAWAVQADIAAALDVTDVNDAPGASKTGTSRLGAGAGIKVMDKSVICHPAVVAKLNALAEEQGIPVQTDIMNSGGTDAGPIQTTRSGVPAGGISVPCRYVHTPAEMVNLEDVENCIRLARALITSETDWAKF